MGNFWTLVLAMPKIWRLLRRPISTGNSIRGLSLSTSTFRLARMFWCLRSQPEFLQCCYESSGAQSGEDSLKTVQETSITDYCSDLFPKDLPWPRTIRTQSHHRLSEFIPLLEVWFQYGSYDKILIFLCHWISFLEKSNTSKEVRSCRVSWGNDVNLFYERFIFFRSQAYTKFVWTLLSLCSFSDLMLY